MWYGLLLIDWGSVMLGFLYRIIVGRFYSCKHKWVESERFDISYGLIKSETTLIVKKCEHCGDLKQVIIGVQ